MKFDQLIRTPYKDNFNYYNLITKTNQTINKNNSPKSEGIILYNFLETVATTGFYPSNSAMSVIRYKLANLSATTSPAAEAISCLRLTARFSVS